VKPLRKSKAFQRKFAKFQRTFGGVVRDLRIKANLSRAELARRAKFATETQHQLLRGMARLSRMADLYRISRTMSGFWTLIPISR
jgi:transcriptional regulator with XRE-family HTH domain